MEQRFALALQHFEQALVRLQEVMSLPEDDIIRDSMIKRFEFSFEAGWKAAYRWLRARGMDVDEAAYSVIPQAFKHRLIVDQAGWGAMRKARNQTAHTYDQELARQVAAFARGSAVGLLGDLLAVLKERADE